jgi:hypothetical protein
MSRKHILLMFHQFPFTLYTPSTEEDLSRIILLMKRRIPQEKPIIILPIYLVGVLVVLAIGFMIFRGIRKEAGNPIVLSASDVPRISAVDAIAAINVKEAFLLDTRSTSQYEVSHARGSFSMPYAEIESWVDTLDKDAWYITYCT